MQFHLGGAVVGSQVLGTACVHQIARDLGLAIHRHLLAAGQPCQIDAVTTTAEAELETVVDQAFDTHAAGHTRAFEQVDGGLFQNAGADAAQHVVGCLPFDNHVVDASSAQQLAEQQSGRSRADDGNLGSLAHARGAVRSSQ